MRRNPLRVSHWPKKIATQTIFPVKSACPNARKLGIRIQILMAGVCSPSTAIILSIPGEVTSRWTTIRSLQEDNFRPLILVLILQTQTIIYII